MMQKNRFIVFEPVLETHCSKEPIRRDESDFPSLSSARSGTFPTDAFIMQLRNLHTCKCMKIRVLFTRHNATVRMYRFWEHYYTRAMPVLVVMICAETISAGKSLKISNQWDYAFRLFSLPLPSEKCYSGPGYNLWCWMGVLGLTVCVVFLYERVEVPSCHRAPFPPKLHQQIHFLIRTKERESGYKVMKKSETGTGRLWI